MENQDTGMLPTRETEQGSLRIFGDPSKLFDALAAAQGEFPDIPRTKTVTVRIRPERGGGQYTFDYSPLDNTQRVLRPILSRHGIAVMQPPCDGAPYRVVTILAGHGARIEVDFTLSKLGDIKEQAGAFTYAQRYQYEGICGVKADTDDDGNAASGDSAVVSDRQPKPAPQKNRTPPAVAPKEPAKQEARQETIPTEAPKAAEPEERAAEAPAVKPDVAIVRDGSPTDAQRAEFKALCAKLGLGARVAVVGKLKEILGKTEGLTEEDTDVVLVRLRAEVAARETVK
ncbi:MAG: ERF family protein [Nitrospira sp.]|nr:ERF family protein [Nitrospira sp.]